MMILIMLELMMMMMMMKSILQCPTFLSDLYIIMMITMMIMKYDNKIKMRRKMIL